MKDKACYQNIELLEQIYRDLPSVFVQLDNKAEGPPEKELRKGTTNTRYKLFGVKLVRT